LLKGPFEVKPHKVKVDAKGGGEFHVTPAAEGEDEDRLGMIVGSEKFRNGTIEMEVSGRPGAGAGAGARGFVGVAFRVAGDGSRFECLYLRPTNGRADDQVRRNHSVQYISFPGFPWAKLRKEFPEKYESYVDLVPGEWTKVKITVDGAKARLYVHGAAQPTLIVNDLKQTESAGGVAFWVGPGTEARFRNVVITAQ
jgi:hypothetical protein